MQRLTPDGPGPAAAPDEVGAAFALERFLPYRLSVLTNTISRAFARTYGKRFGLSIPEWRVMAVLGRFAPLSAGQVAERTAMDKVRVSRAVARLMKVGLVDRTMASDDRRRSALKLSRAGRRVHEGIVPMARRFETAFLASLSDSDRAALDRLVARLMDNAVALDRDGF
jgi:DNA-binding MarR family transcriptional regulator